MKEPDTSTAEEFNPYTPPQVEDIYSTQPKKYPGIGRLAFLIVAIVLLTAQFQLCQKFGIVPPTFGFIGLANIIILPFVYLRLKNVGKNPWWMLMMLMFPLQLIPTYWCLFCPAGYTESQKLDNYGCRALLCILLLSILAILTALLLATYNLSRN
ncbi:MAG: hypothetical protein OJI67_16460 [Prosthecobacter sp.]|nr:hypothetical protein [Prosthecobacter sp.]